MHARVLPALLFLLLPGLCGCFKITDELVINADGSGSVRIETQWLVDPESLSDLKPGDGLNIRNGTIPVYPPTTEGDAKRFFPAQQFVVTTKTQTDADGHSLIIVTAAFKEIEALLASPYAKIHGLTLRIQDGSLKLQAVSGVEAAARMAEADRAFDPDGNKIAGSGTEKKKTNNMRVDFRVRLPGTMTFAGAAGVREDRSVTWILERAKLTNAAAFAEQAGVLLEASCSAEGVGFKPSAAPRLGIINFKAAPSGIWGATPSAVDAKKVRANARFVPYALHVTRTLDLSGDGGVGQSRAQLVGAVVLPKEFIPEKWGDVQVEEILDSKGDSLKLAPDPGNARRFYVTPSGASEADPGEDKENKVGDTHDHRHPFNIVFQAPEWNTKEVARIKGRIDLQYFGGSQTVKLEKAIPAEWIREMKNADEFDFEEAQRNINDPQLPGLGLALNLTMGVSQGPITSLTFQVESPSLAVTDGQIYDVDGRPWPTFFQKESEGDENSITLVVAGNPKAPLSLALIARLVGDAVEIPFVFEKLPIGAK